MISRNRRLRTNDSIRSLVRETTLTTNDLVLPMFVTEGHNKKEAISSMPGVFRQSLDLTVQTIKENYSLGIKAVNLYMKVSDNLKDNTGKESWNENGLMQTAIKTIKDAIPEVIIMPDVALDPYSIYGHDGIIKNGKIDNDSTVDALVKMGISLGMKVKVLTRQPRTETLFLDFFDGQTLNFEITSTNDWNEFLENVEFLSINTPKTKEYILDTPQFEKMKDGVFIVNTARGGVLNEVTLLDFIESGKIAGAALDVFENEPTPELPLLMNPNLSLSPHLGGNTLDAQEKIGTELALQIIDIKKKL